MTHQAAKSFLERYAEAFARFDADEIATHLDVPLTVMNTAAA